MDLGAPFTNPAATFPHRKTGDSFQIHLGFIRQKSRQRYKIESRVRAQQSRASRFT